MSISEQVKELRDKADVFEKSGYAVDGIVKAFREAADTIESLHAKLVDMERSAEDCGGGWIKAKDKLPNNEEYYLCAIMQRFGVIRVMDAHFDGKRFSNIENGFISPIFWANYPIFPKIDDLEIHNEP